MERNLDIAKSLCPAEIVNLICYLSYDCENCPIGHERTGGSVDRCKRKLLDWLLERKDEQFWKYLLEGRKKL